MADWHIFHGNNTEHDEIERLPDPPPWRDFRRGEAQTVAAYRVDPFEIEMVNAALYLRRPLLVTGPPGVGKSTLAKVVAKELKLGTVLRWSITSRSTLTQGLYEYDALARLRDVNTHERTSDGRPATEDIGRYIRLGPLGTALYSPPGPPPNVPPRPRVLLIDEIDKSDIDLPNDLLHAFEDGRYEIPELVRLAGDTEVRVLPDGGKGDADRVSVVGGRVQCQAFPLVIMTSNEEREMPPPFLRRCLRLKIAPPNEKRLGEIVTAHLGSRDTDKVQKLIEEFLNRRGERQLLATDQLLNAVFLLTGAAAPSGAAEQTLRDALLQELGPS